MQNPTVRIHQSTPSPSNDFKPMIAQNQYLGSPWQDMNSAFYKNGRFHKRDSSGSSIISADPPTPVVRNVVYPQIATEQFPTNYEFDFQSPHSKSLPNATEMMYHNSYNSMDMRRIHSSNGDERQYSISAPQSVSTMSHPSPATPHTNYEEFDDQKDIYAYQQPYQIDMNFQQPSMAFAQQQMRNPRVMADRLHAQDQMRTSSPTSNPRRNSPFRQSSPYASQQQQQQQVTRPTPTLQKTRTSVSPKELMLDENDVDDSNATPLFPDQSQYSHRRNQSNLSFYAPQFNHEPTVQIPQTYPFVQSQQSQDIPDSTPEFPAHLVSMESTADEISEPSSQQSMTKITQPQSKTSRPVDTSSDAGTYSCTYHGCNLRFDTPAKLQKHKREGHRQISPSASPTSAMKNSQAGPHRCDRINPSTGKPCHSIFSRPYDLTRHEDTIHNARKQKVRCHLCTEEKTFSRNDALTRHMRVVHPDIDWVGKQKRKTK